MNYNEAIKYIHETEKFGSILGLSNIELLLKLLNNPQEKLKFIHIAGTNGKGSISTMLSNILTSSGYKTGLYTSPYIERFNERIKINNIDIIDEDIAKYISIIKEKIEYMIKNYNTHPTEFEIITALAFLYFYEKEVDIIILEVGLGGRLDATNIIKSPILEIIASISLDHTDYLGNTLKEIAYEKSGIIKKNTNVVVYPSNKEALEEIKRVAKENNATIYETKKEDITLIKTTKEYTSLKYNKQNVFNIDKFNLSLLGTHQAYNSLCVLKALEILKAKENYNITKDTILTSLENTYFAGRFEIINKSPYIILDGGHNIDGINAFVNNINLYFDQKINLFFGMLNDKDIDSSLKSLLTVSKKIYTITPNNNRACSSKDMYKKIRNLNNNIDVEIINNNKDILKYIDLSNNSEIYAFVGSLYSIGEIRKIIKNKLKYK